METKVFVEITGWKDKQQTFSRWRGDSTARTIEKGRIEGLKLIYWICLGLSRAGRCPAWFACQPRGHWPARC